MDNTYSHDSQYPDKWDKPTITLGEEKNDNLGRKIIYNKYKVLDHMYHKVLS